jgi:hypothetical protein
LKGLFSRGDAVLDALRHLLRDYGLEPFYAPPPEPE